MDWPPSFRSFENNLTLSSILQKPVCLPPFSFVGSHRHVRLMPFLQTRLGFDCASALLYSTWKGINLINEILQVVYFLQSEHIWTNENRHDMKENILSTIGVRNVCNSFSDVGWHQSLYLTSIRWFRMLIIRIDYF